MVMNFDSFTPRQFDSFGASGPRGPKSDNQSQISLHFAWKFAPNSLKIAQNRSLSLDFAQ